MRAYIIRRLLLIIPTLFILSILVFLSVRFLPGDVIDAMLGKPEFIGLELDREAVERILGLDVPAYVQYGRWIGVLPNPDWVTGESHLKGILQGSLGHSLVGGRLPVEDQIIGRLPVTVELGVMAIVIGLVIALPVGIYSAIRQDTAADYAGRSFAIVGLATPNFWLALMVMIYPTIWWGWTPPLEWVPFTEDPLGNLLGALLPQPDSGNGLLCRHHADDAHDDAGGLKAGLYPHRLVQGAQGAGRDHPAHHQKCLHPGGLPDRPAVADPGRGRGDHGGHLQPAGDRSAPSACPR